MGLKMCKVTVGTRQKEYPDGTPYGEIVKDFELGYEVEDCPPPAGYKDYNEWLVAAKLNLNRMNKRADEPVRA